MSRNWYSIEAKDDGNESSADIYIFDYIGYWDISARRFINELKALDVDKINLHINSPGGLVFDGIAIQNSLKHHKAKVTVYIDGLAASIASVIALAGDEVRIADNAYVMIHNPASIVWGEAKDMLKEAEVLNKIADGIAGDYSRKMGVTPAEAREMMDEETWWLGQEAVDSGFADLTFTGTAAAAEFDIQRVSAKAPAAVLERFSKSPSPDGQLKPKEANAMTKDVKDQKTPDEPKNGDEPKAADTNDATPKKDEPNAVDQKEPVDVVDAVQAALKADRERADEITDLGEKFGFSAEAKAAVRAGKSTDEFRKEILNKSPDDWKASLQVKNPSTQPSEDELEDKAEGDNAVASIKARRAKLYGG